MKFKVGDRVRAIGEVCRVNLKGKCGTVVCVYPDRAFFDLGVEFDEPFVIGHDCCGKGKVGHCRYGDEREFELIRRCDSKIVITSDGRETLARLYEGNKVVKSAVAKCHPEDTFDFKVGADLAYSRLMGEVVKVAEPKYFKGKAVCIESDAEYLTKGKIYDFSINDGCGESDRHNDIVRISCVSVDAINDRFKKIGSSVRFLEIKE